MNHFARGGVAAIAFTLLALPSSASTVEEAFAAVPPHPSVATVLESCQEDMAMFCGDGAFRMDVLASCLRENEDLLTPACADVQADFRTRSISLRNAMQPFRDNETAACADDAARLCEGSPVGRATCLRLNADDLSPACSSARAQSAEARRVARNLHRVAR
ncbi:MAG: hypothetical protein EA385_15985 [Salinarimonadaceae bacterium]|nr:MAG: hypothetical protein EA385_15985 [Salinarimonadaceae bacterium]